MTSPLSPNYWRSESRLPLPGELLALATDRLINRQYKSRNLHRSHDACHDPNETAGTILEDNGQRLHPWYLCLPVNLSAKVWMYISMV